MRFWFLLLLLLVAAPAWAQVGGGVTQKGTVTPGDVATFSSNNVIQDGGPASSGGSTNFPTGRSITSGASDTATTTDTEVFWNKTTGSASAETIPACNSTNNNFQIRITDEKGDAYAHNITITPASGTILFVTNYVINTNYGSARLHCDGASTNYIAVGSYP